MTVEVFETVALVDAWLLNCPCFAVQVKSKLRHRCVGNNQKTEVFRHHRSPVANANHHGREPMLDSPDSRVESCSDIDCVNRVKVLVKTRQTRINQEPSQPEFLRVLNFPSAVWPKYSRNILKEAPSKAGFLAWSIKIAVTFPAQ